MCLPASCGSSGSGVANNACKLSSTVRMVIAAALHKCERKTYVMLSLCNFMHLPLIFEDIEANSARDGADVRMPNLGGESSFRWIEWIGI
jgi:hypothetical protein